VFRHVTIEKERLQFDSVLKARRAWVRNAVKRGKFTSGLAFGLNAGCQGLQAAVDAAQPSRDSVARSCYNCAHNFGSLAGALKDGTCAGCNGSASQENVVARERNWARRRCWSARRRTCGRGDKWDCAN
jgi:hypothetical protein